MQEKSPYRLNTGTCQTKHLIKFKRSRDVPYCRADIVQRIQKRPELVLREFRPLPVDHVSVYALVQPVPAFPEIFLGYVAEGYDFGKLSEPFFQYGLFRLFDIFVTCFQSGLQPGL